MRAERLAGGMLQKGVQVVEEMECSVKAADKRIRLVFGGGRLVLLQLHPRRAFLGAV